MRWYKYPLSQMSKFDLQIYGIWPTVHYKHLPQHLKFSGFTQSKVLWVDLGPPQKVYRSLPPILQNVIVFENKVCTERSYWSGVDLIHYDGVLIRRWPHADRDTQRKWHVTLKAGVRVTQLQHKESHQNQEEARREPLQGSEGAQPHRHPDFGLPTSKTMRQQMSIAFSLPVHGALEQQP